MPLSWNEIRDRAHAFVSEWKNETLWLTQALIAELFGKDVRTVNEHLQNIYAEGELSAEATIRKFRIVRNEGRERLAREPVTAWQDLRSILTVAVDR